MKTTETLREWIDLYNEDALLADGFEDAIVGVVAGRCAQPTLVVYDAEKCIEILTETTSMSRDEAVEFFEFNIEGAWEGENTPLFLWRKPDAG